MSGNDHGESRAENLSAEASTVWEQRAEKPPKGSSRRVFLGQVGGVATGVALGAVTAGVSAGSAAAAGSPAQEGSFATGVGSGRARALQSFNNRVSAAQAELNVRIPNEATNGDEQRFANRIGNYSKGLVHNGIGEVDNASYASYLRALNSGDHRLFDQIQMGGNALLVDPQAGLAFDLEGTDSHQLAIGTPPSATSREIAAGAVENYWMARCRDVNFTQYGNEPLTQAAIAELNTPPGFHGPRPVTPQNLFRGFTAGDVLGRPGLVPGGAERAGTIREKSDRSEPAAHAQRPRDWRLRPCGCAF